MIAVVVLFASTAVAKEFNKYPEGNIAKAEKNWPDLVRKNPR
jgi:hypothetical protein